MKKVDIQIIFQDKLKFYLPESLLYKINNPDAEFLFHIGIVLLVIVLIVLLIGDQKIKDITKSFYKKPYS